MASQFIQHGKDQFDLGLHCVCVILSEILVYEILGHLLYWNNKI